MSGGTTFFVSDLSDELAKIGVDVMLFSNTLKNKDSNFKDLYLPKNKDIKIQLIEHQDNFISKIFAASYRKELTKSIINENVNLMHITGLWEPSVHASFALARKHLIPTIVSPQGMLEPWALNNNFYKKKFSWYLYQNRDLKYINVFHATAEQEAENLKRLGLKQPIAIIPNGINLENYDKTQNISKFDNNKLYGAKKDDRRKLLYLSRIHPKKGLINLVKAWEKLKSNKWKVIVAGPDEGGHRQEVEKLISEKKLSQYFEFIGPVEGKSKYDLYKSSDLFILPTYSENFGIVVAEALMSGLPVITTKGAPWEGLIKNNCGWWIDIGVDPMIKTLKIALSLSPEILDQMGNRGKIYAENNFGYASIAKKMLEVYDWILKKKNRPNFIV
jgi:glycosyltransferase involved in cell wall biosynthesis